MPVPIPSPNRKERWPFAGPSLLPVHRAFVCLAGLFFGFLAGLPAARAQEALPRTESERLEHLVSAIPHPLRRSFGGGSHGASRELQDRFDVSFYHLNLNLDPDRTPEVLGHVRVQGRALVRTDTMQLDLHASMRVLGVFSGSTAPLSWAHQGNRLLIVPSTPLESVQEHHVDIVYQGDPVWNSALGGYTSGRRPGGDRYIWTLSEPYGSMTWWPTEDHPADKADSVQVTLTVPTGITAVSQGTLESEIAHENGTTTFDWFHRYPIATYLVSIAAGEYRHDVQTYERPADLEARYGGARFPIESWAYPGVPAFEGISETSGWRLTPEVMATFERWFGPYPFAREKYGNAHFTVRGGMEHQTVSSMGNIGIELIAHELAHQWMGDAVTPSSWRDLWLNEGFATLGEMLAFEADPKYRFIRGLLFNIYYNRARDARGTLVLADTTDASDMFVHARVYAKGWMVLRMIRHQVGDQVFQQILETWATQHRYGSVGTRDFQRVVETATGRDWSLFFDQWAYTGTGEPQFAAAWQDLSAGGQYRVRVQINQIQEADESNTPAFALPLPVVVRTDTDARVFVLDVTQRQESWDLDLDAPPVGMEVDPDRWILKGETLLLSETRV
ncbi:MAG: M1 family aminopeptidase, partial [Bacteroidetes bacterium]|nr:M1 family aminopeptidase [Bacteroidota bacterium]